MRGSAIFSHDRTLRREIRRWWVEEPKRWAAWLMLNPSNAGPTHNDPTALRVTHFSAKWGYDGWIGVNLYPLISSTPKQLWTWRDWKNAGPDWHVRDCLQANISDIERVARQSSIRMVAFGNLPAEHDPDWLQMCLEAYGQPSDYDADEQLFCLGMTKTGQPLHPMARGKFRAPDSAIAIPWRD